MSLLLCIACGHPWIYHEEHGCASLTETYDWESVAVCGCKHEGRCDGCVLPDTTARVVRRPGDGGGGRS